MAADRRGRCQDAAVPGHAGKQRRGQISDRGADGFDVGGAHIAALDKSVVDASIDLVAVLVDQAPPSHITFGGHDAAVAIQDRVDFIEFGNRRPFDARARLFQTSDRCTHGALDFGVGLSPYDAFACQENRAVQ